jgi:hypothetical protein
MNQDQESREKIVYSSGYNSRTDLQSHLGVLVWEFLDGGHWASNRQIQIGTRGYYTERYTTLEILLKKWSDKEKIRSCNYGNIKAYAKKGKTRNFDILDKAAIYHGLGANECRIRFTTAREGIFIPQKSLRGYKRVAELAVLYENGSMPLIEFSTKNDVDYSGKLRGKLLGYNECLDDIASDFNAKPFVVFVLDVSRDRVRRLIEYYKPEGRFFFTDFRTFFEVPMGQALIAPIYFWTDGKEYAISR